MCGKVCYTLSRSLSGVTALPFVASESAKTKNIKKILLRNFLYDCSRPHCALAAQACHRQCDPSLLADLH